jgi:hypothetical protein
MVVGVTYTRVEQSRTVCNIVEQSSCLQMVVGLCTQIEKQVNKVERNWT